MKKLFIAACTALSFIGCAKIEDGPLERLTENYVFDPTDRNGFYAEQFLNNIYSILPNGYNRVGGDLLDAATDDAMPSRDGVSIERFTTSSLSALSNPDDAWGKNYEGIRKVNIFLKNIDIVPVPAKIPFWKAEARFLRAMFYFELVKRYGGVPLVADEVLDAEKPKNFTRNSFEECINYIVTECDAIKGAVRPDPLATTDYGRISNGVVLALKARTLLYAASPLYNGGNIGGSAQQKLYQGYASFDAERWNAAAQAANDLIATGRFKIDGVAYNNVFIVRKNDEVILGYLRNNSTDLETNNGPVGYALASAQGRTSPTQDLVDAFPAVNGREITDPVSGYVSTNPYANRDPRLASTVLYNGLNWLSRPLQTYEGGLDKPNNNTTQTKTGYYMRKHLGNFSTATLYNAQPHNFPIFRYAEVLLNYAEARNEYLTTPDASVYKVLQDIRKRAGIAVGTTAGYSYGLKSSGMTKDEMRIAIRNERRIEMAFEEQRFWDLRRWKTAETELNKNLNGMIITRNPANGALTYQKSVVGKISFANPRMYFYPIPFNEINKNTNLVQNTGW
ncbi:MAG: RagB/SusD family nutrient uptake outer membrane protein [Pedobacter sp.]|uniref:RagB/SusD family nutrient uptake outer membrane protein n=1 Tax=Pedobacter sp. TaxID=1411316 RepID=UPI002807D69F|nr:RagB/SusD family nutrient uptake outer membrane protein [Pedobacter sp.]MDQ8005316.1 RagB/SusD family nutrient uptake outer membrane protein [Pedobacter sp.]